jgi:Tol biopolymer transport system component
VHTTEQINAALDGRYIIERLVGEGGMATVFLARDVKHKRPVALKVLKPDLGAIVGVDRFLGEIQVTANLQHPNLLPLFDSGSADSVLFYVMPFVEGETLRARLQREHQLPVDEALRMATAIAGALDYAHRHGVIHRDLKPENILLVEGQPLVADFGIALAVSKAGDGRITQTGLSLGTPQYMSPEQATGDRVIDARADIYSLGAVLYEMLTGEPPHTGSTSQAIIARMMTERPRTIRTTRATVPVYVEAAVMRALEKLPADRWSSAKEFAEALNGSRSVMVTQADVAGPGDAGDGRSTLERSLRRTRAVAAGAVAVAAVALVASALREPAAADPVWGMFDVMLPESVTVSTVAGSKVALSPDGMQLVVVGVRGQGRRALYRRGLSDPTFEQVRGSDSAFMPVFSPDGQRLAFIVDGTLRTVPISGGVPRILTDTAFAPTWGDDGRIYFTRGASVYSILADGGDLQPVLRPDTVGIQRGFRYPHALPGADRLVVGAIAPALNPDSTRLALVDVASGELTDLGIFGEQPRYVDSGHLLYSRGMSGEIYAVPFSLRRGQPTGPAVLVQQDVWNNTAGAAGYDVSRNGAFTFHRGTGGAVGTEHLIAVTPDGREELLSRAPASYKEPRISPDGQRVVVRDDASVTAGDLWLIELRTGGRTRLTSDNASIRGEWSRDGTRVVFLSSTDSVRAIARSWDRSAPDQVLATSPLRGARSLETVSLGPSGGWSAVRIGTDVTNPDVFIAPTDSLHSYRPLPVAATAASERMPRVSPNGRLLAFTSTESGAREVYVTPIPGPGPRVLVSAAGGTEPMWSPDGRYLYFRSTTADPRLMRATIVERPTLSVTSVDPLFADVFRRYDWHQAYDIFPDGRRFLMVGQPPNSRSTSTPGQVQVTLMTDWQRMLSRR